MPCFAFGDLGGLGTSSAGERGEHGENLHQKQSICKNSSIGERGTWGEPVPETELTDWAVGSKRSQSYMMLEDDTYAYQRKINCYYPFHDEGEWELGRFMVENLTHTQIIKFLKLKWLIWCDALEVVKQLFSDPIFANHMTYTPHVVDVGNQREYGDYMSADMAWKIQVHPDHLPVGATQVPIILGSDKTHVMQITGGLEMHPVFITIGNIDLEVHSKATLRAWQCIAYMPIAKFHVHPDYQGILQARLWHKCMAHKFD
ncbi:hypothetical protein BDR07DRAFT_1380636 [Suillus spraguei]|nr:hypothetical protein BDR07DRAFT_1380636 [Suillus spraguei]